MSRTRIDYAHEKKQYAREIIWSELAIPLDPERN